MQEFKYLDGILLLSGCKVFRGKRLLTLVNNIQFLILTIGSCLTVCIGLADSVFSKSQRLYVLTYYTLGYTSAIVFRFVMRRQIPEMRDYLILLLSRIPVVERKRLQSVSLWYSITLMSLMLVSGVGHLQAAISFHSKTSQLFYASGWYVETYVVISSRWLALSCLLVAFFIKVSSSFEQTILQALHSHLRKGGITVTASLLVLCELKTQKKRVMQLFSIIPCLAVFCLFFTISGLIMQLRHTGVNGETFVETTTTGMNIVCLFYMTYTGEKSVAQSESMGEMIENLLLSTRDRKWDRVTERLRALTRMQYTSCRIIEINCKFFLTFMSTLITLTALFTQVLTNIPA